jgi:C4-type Zn-finger protein
MPTDSYNGETQEWTCPECDTTLEIASDEFRAGYSDPSLVYCSVCEATQEK